MSSKQVTFLTRGTVFAERETHSDEPENEDANWSKLPFSSASRLAPACMHANFTCTDPSQVEFD